MLDKKTERLIQLSQGPEYRAFGFGTNPPEFARRLLEFREQNPGHARALFDVADRVLFTDYLRFEVGWEIEGATRDMVDSARFSPNLDALEIYLLCTCIDALAGNRQSPASFVEWLEANPHEVCAALAGHPSCSPAEYASVTKLLFRSYRDTEVSMGQKFRDFFKDLPTFIKEAVADSLILIKGDYWSKQSREKLENWATLKTDVRLNRLARDYWYGIRRSKYTHSAHKDDTTSPGHWRRLAERGAMPASGNTGGWKPTLLRSTDDPDKIKYTVLTRTSIEEGTILRAIIAVHVLTSLLEYSVSEDYLCNFLEYCDIVAATYAFLCEMQDNRSLLDLLTSHRAIIDSNLFQSSQVAAFSMSAGERLLAMVVDSVAIMREDIGHYFYHLSKLNSRIGEFNATSEPADTDWGTRQRALVDFSRELALLQHCSSLRWYYRWIYPNLKRHVEEGQFMWHFAGIATRQEKPLQLDHLDVGPDEKT